MTQLSRKTGSDEGKWQSESELHAETKRKFKISATSMYRENFMIFQFDKTKFSSPNLRKPYVLVCNNCPIIFPNGLPANLEQSQLGQQVAGHSKYII